MSDDNNQKSRGPRKGGGAGGRGGGRDGGSRGGFGGGRGPSRFGGSEGGERKPFRPRGEGGERPGRGFGKPAGERDSGDRPFRARPEGGDRPFRARPEGGERPFRARPEGGDRPFRARPEGGDRPFRARPEGGERPFRARSEGGERPFRARPEGERGPGRPSRDGGKRFERPRRPREEEAGSAAVILPSLIQEPERIAKVMARAGVASRRECEAMILEGRVKVNGAVIESPALDVGPDDVVLVDGEPLPERERTRMWLYHKPRGLVTTNFDPEGRPTVFEALPEDLPRVLSVGRLDINTEGLLLLTNDGGLARMLELPETGWLRRYRVRAYGHVTQERLDTLRDGVTIDGVVYGPVVARFERQQGANTWLTVDLREGKNREVKTVLDHIGLDVNRLIRVSFGPFQLGDLPEGEVDEIRTRVLKDQLGTELIAKAGADLDAPRRDEMEKVIRAEREDARRAPSRAERARRFEDGERDRPEVVRTPSQDDRSEKPWKRTTWRDAEAEPQRARKAPPRRGADPKLERQTREATGEIVRKRDKAIEDPNGRRVLVERVSASPRETVREATNPNRRPDRLPRHERGKAQAAFREEQAERPQRGERPVRRPREEAPGRDRGEERPWYDSAAAQNRPARAPRSFGDKPGGGAKSFAARSSQRPQGRSEGPGRGFGGKPGGKPFGGRPGSGGGRPGGGRPGGRPGGAPRGKRD